MQDSTGFHFCGGSVLDKNTIMSAAHCCQDVPSHYKIVAGAHDISLQESTQQRVDASEVIPHAQFDYYTSENDICLIKLASSLTLNM